MEGYVGSNKEGKDRACWSEQKEMILRNVEILCRTASIFGDVIVNGLLDVMNSASFDLNVVWSTKQQAKHCQEFAQREGSG